MEMQRMLFVFVGAAVGAFTWPIADFVSALRIRTVALWHCVEQWNCAANAVTHSDKYEYKFEYEREHVHVYGYVHGFSMIVKCIQFKYVFRALSSFHVYANGAAFIPIEMLLMFASEKFHRTVWLTVWQCCNGMGLTYKEVLKFLSVMDEHFNLVKGELLKKYLSLFIYSYFMQCSSSCPTVH